MNLKEFGILGLGFWGFGLGVYFSFWGRGILGVEIEVVYFF